MSLVFASAAVSDLEVYVRLQDDKVRRVVLSRLLSLLDTLRRSHIRTQISFFASPAFSLSTLHLSEYLFITLERHSATWHTKRQTPSPPFSSQTCIAHLVSPQSTNHWPRSNHPPSPFPTPSSPVQSPSDTMPISRRPQSPTPWSKPGSKSTASYKGVMNPAIKQPR